MTSTTLSVFYLKTNKQANNKERATKDSWNFLKFLSILQIVWGEMLIKVSIDTVQHWPSALEIV